MEKMMREGVSPVVLGRLALYYRILQQKEADGVEYYSSRELGKTSGVTAEVIRRDLCGLGSYGLRGIGYPVAALRQRLEEVLGYQRRWNAMLVGQEESFWDWSRWQDFLPPSLSLVTVVEVWEGTSEQKKAWKELVEEHAISVGILAVPAAMAQGAAEQLIAAGVKSIVNLTPVPIRVSPPVRLFQLHIGAWFSSLSHYLHQQEDDEDSMAFPV